MLHRLLLENFRNFSRLEIGFDPKLTVLRGPNAAGKTNLLEALALFVFGKSFRTNHHQELLKYTSSFARLQIFQTNERQKQDMLEILFSQDPAKDLEVVKILRFNGKRQEITDLIGRIPAVLFAPEEVGAFFGAPSERRKFLNAALVPSSAAYLKNLREYQQILRRRNELLSGFNFQRVQLSEFDFWDERLVVIAEQLWVARTELADFLQANFSTAYRELGGTSAQYSFVYRGPKKNLRALLQKNLKDDARRGATSAGPHRDDWSIFQDNHDLKLFGSRGEWRTAVLALKFLTAQFLEQKTQKRPLLLLDDPTSELDLGRAEAFLKIISAWQTVLTTSSQALKFPEGKIYEVGCKL